MADAAGLASVEHVVVLMMENHSFDHMLGYLYPGNVSPSGQPFDGLTGTESNPGSSGQPKATWSPTTSSGAPTAGLPKTLTFSSPTIFGLLDAVGLGWAVYGYDEQPLTKSTFTQLSTAAASHFGLFTDFRAAAPGTLPAYTFLEPSWSPTGNSQHPNYDVALGEQLIHDVYEALRAGPGWPGALLVITYDEHGGCYDHVPPPWGAVPPDSDAGEFGFGFGRFGVRVPTVLVSPLIVPGTVYRVPASSAPLDHTSVLKTVEQRWNLTAPTARDAAAPGFGDVLTLTTPRTDDVLAGVTVPLATSPGPAAGTLSHLEAIHAELISRQYPAGASPTGAIS